MKGLFCEDKNDCKLCVRRVLGTVGFLCFIVAVFIGVEHASLELLGMLSASLIGLTTVDKFVK